jgi:hypothetical protein
MLDVVTDCREQENKKISPVVAMAQRRESNLPLRRFVGGCCLFLLLCCQHEKGEGVLEWWSYGVMY